MFKKSFLFLCIAFMALKATAQTFTPQELNGDSTYYYLLNKATNLFITENGLSEHRPLQFLCTENEDGKFVFENSDHTFLNIDIEANSGILGGASPKSVSCAINGEATSFTVGGQVDGYTLSVTATWKYGILNRKSATYTAFLTVAQQEAGDEEGTVTSTLSTTTVADASNNYWVLVSPDEYAASPAARTDALDRLNDAIAAAEAAAELEGPSFKVAELKLRLTAAKATKSSAESSYSWISSRVSNDDINSAAQSLEEATAAHIVVCDYYATCLEEIDEIEEIGGTAIKGACDMARVTIKGKTTTDGMNTTVNNVRLLAIATVMSKDELPENTNLSGLMSNHSFEMGDMSGWYNFKINTSELGNAASAIMSGNLSGLGSLVSVGEFSDYSTAVANNGINAIADGHKKYYYNTSSPSLISAGEPIFQPIIGLPNGEYRLSALMTSKSTLNANIASVIIVPNDVFTEILGNIDLTQVIQSGQISMSYIMQLIFQNIGTIIEQSTIVYGKNSPRSSTKFEEVTCDFTVEESSLVIPVFNAGATPLVGNVINNPAFKADNVRLTYLQKIQVPGDVNVDGKVTIVDVASAIAYMINPEIEGFKPANADFGKDGKVTPSDITTLGNMILNK